MLLFTYVAGFIAILYTLAAAALFFIGSKSHQKTVLTLYLATAVAWIGTNVAADVAYTPGFLVLVSGIAFIAGGLNLLCCLALIDTIIDNRAPSLLRLAIYALLTTGPGLFAFTELGIAGTYFPPGLPAQIIPGPIYIIGIFTMPAYLIYGAVRLIWRIRTEQDYTRRMQVIYVLAGLMLTLSG